MLLAALLLLVPVTAQAAPSLRVTVTPLSQTVKAGQPAVFTIALKNTGDTILSPIIITDDLAPECNRIITGLISGRIMIHTCSHRNELQSYENGVMVTGYSPVTDNTVSSNATARIMVEPLAVADLFASSFPTGLGLRIQYLAGFTRWNPAGWFGNPGTLDISPAMNLTSTYLDAATSAALARVSGGSQTLTESIEDEGNSTDEPAESAGMAISTIFRTDVFTRGGGDYYYTDPVIKMTPDGSLILFADTWKYNETDPTFLTPTTSLVYKRSTDNGVTWGPMGILDSPGEFFCAFNSASVVDWTNGRIWIFYLFYHPGRDTIRSRPGTTDTQILARWSDDSGLSWSDPLDLTPVARDMTDPSWNASIPGPGGAIQTSRARLLVPMWKIPYGNFAIYSDDHGITWQRGQPVPTFQGGNENQMVEMPDGRILMNIRQLDGPHRWFTESNDGGETWSEPWPSFNVTTVRSAVEEYLYLSDGGEQNCILWTGPKGLPWEVEGEKGFFQRWFLTFRVSCDGGRTFPTEYMISDEAASYSDMTILGDNTVGVAWERGDQTPDEYLTFARLSIHPGPR